jgi:hypothetical protein
MTVRRTSPRFLPALLALPLAAAMFVPASASAATSSENPVFMIWKPGTPLPMVPEWCYQRHWPPRGP